MSESFEEIISDIQEDLDAFQEIDAPVAYEAAISAGYFLTGHGPGCTCPENSKTMLVITFYLVSGEKNHIAVPLDSPLGRALTTDAMKDRCNERIADIT